MRTSKKNVIALSGFLLTALSFSSAFAQRPGSETDFTSLFSRSCQQTGWGNIWINSPGDISVNRRLYEYTSVLSPGPRDTPLQITCRVNNRGSRAPFGTLRLTIGQSSSRYISTRINLYLDGNRVASYTLTGEDMRTILVDVSNAEDFTIETMDTHPNINQLRYIRLYIIDDTLEPLY